MKMAVFWVVTPCGMVNFTDVSEVLAASIIKAFIFTPMLQAASTYETSVSFCQITRRNNPLKSHLHTRRRKNLNTHLGFYYLYKRLNFVTLFNNLVAITCLANITLHAYLWLYIYFCIVVNHLINVCYSLFLLLYNIYVFMYHVINNMN
jgi:hypothetical protein